jgi:hypothetical protein
MEKLESTYHQKQNDAIQTIFEKEQLKEKLNDDILFSLQEEGQGPLIENEKLIKDLGVAKETEKEVEEIIATLTSEIEVMMEIRENYR